MMLSDDKWWNSIEIDKFWSMTIRDDDSWMNHEIWSMTKCEIWLSIMHEIWSMMNRIDCLTINDETRLRLMKSDRWWIVKFNRYRLVVFLEQLHFFSYFCVVRLHARIVMIEITRYYVRSQIAKTTTIYVKKIQRLIIFARSRAL